MSRPSELRRVTGRPCCRSRAASASISASGVSASGSPLVAVQTPQGFVADRLRAAHASGADASDDATLVEADGGSVVVVDGDAANLKITNPLDLQIAELLLGESS